MADSTPTADRVRSALEEVDDPALETDVVSAGVLADVRVEEGTAVLEADLDGRGPAAAQELAEAMLSRVRDVQGVEGAHVAPSAPSGDDRVAANELDPIIAVASAKGGVGKTTVATGLACALAADRDVALFDADIYGPNVPDLLDLSGPIRADDQDRPMPARRGPLEVLSVGLMSDGGPLAWRGAMAHDAVADLLENARWRSGSAMVVDLPPGTGDVALTTLESLAVDGVVVVTTPFQTSVEDTRRSIELFREDGVPVLGVVVNMAHFTCECGRDHELFPGDAVADLDVPVIARLPFAPEFQADPRPGDVPAAFGAIVEEIESGIAAARDPDLPPDAVDIRGRHPRERVDRVRDAFEALAPGERLHVVSDRDPTPAGEFLVELCEDSGPPTAVLGTFAVERRGPETWLLTAEAP